MIECRPSDERGFRNTQNRYLRSSYCCSVYPAVRNSYRALLRSSSIREPSDPPLRVIALSINIISSYISKHALNCLEEEQEIVSTFERQYESRPSWPSKTHYYFSQLFRQQQLSTSSGKREPQVPLFHNEPHCDSLSQQLLELLSPQAVLFDKSRGLAAIKPIIDH